MNSAPARIRLYQPDDLDDVYRVCLLTANDGQDATALVRDPGLPGHVWVGPYVTFEPSLAFVVEDGDGVGGYVLGVHGGRPAHRRAVCRRVQKGVDAVVPGAEAARRQFIAALVNDPPAATARCASWRC